MHTELLDILIIFIAALPVAFLFHKLKLPSMVGMIVAGVIIGPSGFGFIDSSARVENLAEIGIALLMFSIGLEFSLKHFAEMKLTSLGTGLLQIILTVILTVMIAFPFGLSTNEGIVLGFAMALSSTAVVLSILSHKRLVSAPHGRISTGILILQDVCTVIMLAVVPFFAVTSTVEASQSMHLLIAIGKALAFIAGVLLFGRFILPQLLHLVSATRSKELFLITIIVLALGLSSISAALGLTFALGAFLSGLMISETDFRFHALSEIAPFKYAMISIFFVSIGMLFSPAFFVQNFWVIILLSLAVILGKGLLISTIVMLFRYPLSVAVLAGFALAQIGEFSFIIIMLAKNLNIVSQHLYGLVISVTAITLLLTPILMEISEPASRFLQRRLPKRRSTCSYCAGQIDVEKMEKHVIICGFGPLGEAIGNILEEASINYVVLELNPATVRRVRFMNRPVYLGDGASSEILYHSGIERARAIAITAPDYMNSVAIVKQSRALRDDIKIIVRARFKNQVADLYSAGADYVISEEFEAGLEMGRHVLTVVGIDESAADDHIGKIRSLERLQPK